MPDSLAALESHRAELLRSIANLNDMRPGSIVGAVWRCGKPNCHCAHPDDPGHGPNLRLTYKWHGKTITHLEGNNGPRGLRSAAALTVNKNLKPLVVPLLAADTKCFWGSAVRKEGWIVFSQT